MKKNLKTHKKLIPGVFIAFMCFFCNEVVAQQPSGVQKEVKESFENFFKTNKTSPVNLDSIQKTNVKMLEIIKKSPDRKSKLDRLLYYQEHKKAQSNLLDIINSPLFLEASVGDEVDFSQVIAWNNIIMDITAKDHTALPRGSVINFRPFEQVGPARTSRCRIPSV
jgi:hypothetical protein